MQDGCDNSCGYCRTTIARGPAVSLPAEEAVRRALEIEAKGFHEIMLTGVNLTMYDHDGEGLGGLVEKLLAALGDGMRLRLSSMTSVDLQVMPLPRSSSPRSTTVCWPAQAGTAMHSSITAAIRNAKNRFIFIFPL